MTKDPKLTSVGDDTDEIEKRSLNDDHILIAQEGFLRGRPAASDNPAVEVGSSDTYRGLQARLDALSQQLKARETELAEANATVKVLLRQRETDREELMETIMGGINELIRPFLDKLESRKLGADEKSLLAVVKQNLDQLVSPLPPRMPSVLGSLSPTEIQVIHLIRQGKTSKDIARLMGVAQSTIDFHRHNIRRKLRLSNTQQNLKTYLTAIGHQNTE